MLKTIILLTKSRKHGGYCTTGIDIQTGKWIRIVSNGIGSVTDEITSRQLSYDNGEEAEIFDVIKIHCIGHNPIYYQPENYINDNNQLWQKKRQANLVDVIQLHPFEDKEYIYFNTDYKITDDFIRNLDVENKYSLIFIKVTNVVVKVDIKPWNNVKGVSINFRYKNRFYNYFRITDDDFTSEYLTYGVGDYPLNGCYSLIISLGEPFERNFNHYKLIAKVFKV